MSMTSPRPLPVTHSGPRLARLAPPALALCLFLGAAAVPGALAAQEGEPVEWAHEVGDDGVVLNGKTRGWMAAAAVLAAPESLRDGAEVRAWTEDERLVTLRPGTNDIICLADRPGDGRFAAACYHAGLEPFMERGRELLRQGVRGVPRNEARWREIEAGTLPMPTAGMVYNLSFGDEDFDPAATDPATGGRLHALYLRDATGSSTGLPVVPGAGPWLMHAGTPSAHVMIGLPTRGGG